MIKKKLVTCIQCPFACSIEAELDENGDIISLQNAKCKRGEKYARSELIDPKRVLTTTVKIVNSNTENCLMPVQTNRPISKALLKEVMNILANVEVKIPIKYDQVIMKNIVNTDVNVVATSEVLT